MKSPNAAQAAVDMLLNIEKAAIITSKSIQSAIRPTVKSTTTPTASTSTISSTIPSPSSSAAVSTTSVSDPATAVDDVDVQTVNAISTTEVPVSDVRVVDEVIYTKHPFYLPMCPKCSFTYE